MFLTEMVLAADLMPDLWVFRRPLVWCDKAFGRIEVPYGFRTDLASIPRIGRSLEIFDPNGPSRLPAAVHDFLYRQRTKGKAFADDFLRAALIQQGMSRLGAEIYYEAVHLFGGAAWRSDIDGMSREVFDTETNFKNYCNCLAP